MSDWQRPTLVGQDFLDAASLTDTVLRFGFYIWRCALERPTFVGRGFLNPVLTQLSTKNATKGHKSHFLKKSWPLQSMSHVSQLSVL